MECTFETHREKNVQEADEGVQRGVSQWQEEVEMTHHPGYAIPYVFHLPPFLCLHYLDYKSLLGATHNIPGGLGHKGLPQAQHNVKTNSEGDLQDHRNTGEHCICSVNSRSEITTKGQKSTLHWCPPVPSAAEATLITRWSSLTIRL